MKKSLKKKGGAHNNIIWKFLSDYFNNHDAFKGLKSKSNKTINIHKNIIETIFRQNTELIIDILIYFNFNKEQQKLYDISKFNFIKETINKTLLHLVSIYSEDIDLPVNIINSTSNYDVLNIKRLLDNIIYNNDTGLYEIFFDYCLYGSLPKSIKKEMGKLWIQYASKNIIDAFFDLKPYKNVDDLPIWIYYRVSIWENIYRGDEKHSIYGFLGASGKGKYNFCGPGTKIVIRTQEPFWHFYLLLTNILEHNVNGKYPWNQGVSPVDECCKEHDLNYVSASWDQQPPGLLFDDEMEQCIKQRDNISSAPRTLMRGLASAKTYLGINSELFTNHDPRLTKSYKANNTKRRQRAKNYTTNIRNNMNPLINMEPLNTERPRSSNSYKHKKFQPSNITKKAVKNRKTHKMYLNHLKQRNNNNVWGTYCPEKRYYCSKGSKQMKNWCVKQNEDCYYNGILLPGMRKRCKSYEPGKSGEACGDEDDETPSIHPYNVKHPKPPIPPELDYAYLSQYLSKV